MPNVDRRHFLKLAAAMGATLAWGCSTLRPSSSGWRERRDLYPQGVASGDPDADSVLLWTRRPYADGRDSAMLLVLYQGYFIQMTVWNNQYAVLGDDDITAAELLINTLTIVPVA